MLGAFLWAGVLTRRAFPLSALRVVQALVAQQLQLSEEEAGRRLQQLQQLLPGLQQQLHTMDPNTVARMAADVTAVAARLLQASEPLCLYLGLPPQAACSMAAPPPFGRNAVMRPHGVDFVLVPPARPPLPAAVQLRAIFPGADAFKLALREPFLVYGSTIFRLQRAAAELRRMLPGMDIDRWVPRGCCPVAWPQPTHHSSSATQHKSHCSQR